MLLAVRLFSQLFRMSRRGRSGMANINIDLDRKIGSVDPRIFGNFIEHLGRCIYGGVFDEGSPLSDERGFRRDVLEAIRPLRMPILRWPGGNFVSGYHWADGVGPRADRPRRTDLAWYAEESNRFGTNEFIQYCRLLDTEPYICVNMGSGTMDEAQAWVEYANSTRNTHWANLRRKHGSSEPYQVKYWGLGNEMYGGWQIGALEAMDYVKKARAFGMVMKRMDPSIVLVGCGQNGWNQWDEIVLEGLAPMVDFHSIHLYTGHSDYYVNVFQPHQAERAVRICERTIERVRHNQRIPHPIYIAFDEWNVWYRTRSDEDRVAGIEERYNLADALAVATYLNVFIRYCRIVRIANFAQLVNAIAPIFTNQQGLFLQTIYHPLRLYAEHTQAIALDVHVDCEVYDLPPAQEEGGFGRRHHIADLGPFKLLDAVATCDTTGRQVTLAVVNRDKDRGHKATIQFAGGGAPSSVTVAEVNGAGPEAMNSFDHPDAVGVREHRMNLTGSHPDYLFPAHSITLLRFGFA
jgi:alpha-N-arabinofuranosidase